ncbi:ATP-grasp domain-containing protein [Mongoliitalea daihaiensis]|uniref:ATP-grasp domain-containing protein n=1 Tax=Mongoliitalea daihaiensis TaxID=2782006 RepID=UPI001F45F8DD|nr:ATP-grasp domain-containing protein [Mongoliitalea daihaiensis]UJP64587.1 ATP-grasp domain-containing protein [Mongoliitalea daihaiensis]
MILLDFPYVSDFLKDTIVSNKIPVIATAEAKTIMHDQDVNWLCEMEAREIFKANPTQKLYSNSENSISWVHKHLPNSPKANLIEVFKNKFKFRKLIQDTYPSYFFQRVTFDSLEQFDLSEVSFPFIIKPAVGFFSLAVFKVDRKEDWADTVFQIQETVSKIQDMYPSEVVDNTEFILESYIKGDEYAFDCYFNEEGNPVVLNILKHLFASESDVSDRVYCTSEEIFQEMYEPIMSFLKMVGSKVDLQNFPLHIEIRKTASGEIIPIEVNPMRFGGWCTTGDLAWFAYGINSYQYFLDGKKPNWEDIFATRKNKIFSLILLDNQAKVKQEDFAGFDYEAICQDFEEVIHVRKHPLNHFGVFGFLFTSTSKGNEKELYTILHSDLTKYIRLQDAVIG